MSDLPSGWTETPLENVVDVLDRLRVPVNAKERAKRPGTVPYYGATGQVDTIDQALFDEELVLLGEDGAPFLDPAKRKAYIVDGPSWVNNHAHVLRAIEGVTTNRFLKYQLDAIPYAEHVNGTTRLKLTQKAMRAMPFRLPPLAEQERIVAAIEEHCSHLDAGEAALNDAERDQERLQLALTLEALHGQWPTNALGDHTIEQRYGSSAKASTEGDVPVLRMGNIVDGKLDFDNLKYLPAGHEDLDTCVLEDGDLLFNRTNSPELVGKSAVYRDTGSPVAFASYLIRVRTTDDLDPDWACLAINSPAGRRYIDEVRTQQVGQSNVNGTKLKNFPIPVPPLHVQKKRLAALHSAEAQLSRTRTSIVDGRRRANTLRRSLLASAFAGRLVEQDPDDEPAAALLDRVRAENATTKKTTRGKKASA